PAPAEVVAYVSLVNEAMGFPERPVPLDVPADFLADVRGAIDDMPAVVKRLLQGELLAVVFARGLGSSAITDIVVRPDGSVIGAVVALDFDAFAGRSANGWATWKENTPFTASTAMTLEAFIAAPRDDNRKYALQYLLLHEFGHVLTFGKAMIPDWWIDPQTMLDSDDYTFLPLAWQVGDNKHIVPLPENDFALRSRVAYYSGAKLSGDEMVPAYQALQQTNFATLYAATNVYEDFAESFVTYVHTVLMKKRLEIRICRDGQIVLQPPAYWGSARSAVKERFMQAFLGT
ncbi:MAG TPA: hypothetical protein VGP06_10315, partial [Janthinobacterium sp.]|nr:hypothetical protein [Janthinobacterium sp.]